MKSEEYKIKGETPDKKTKVKYWECAIGLQKVDGLNPSSYLIDLAQQNVDGKLSYTEVEKLLYKKYENETEEERVNRVRESDLVSTRIANILDGGGFTLNPESLKTIHGILFQDIYSHAGKFRQYNISKDEPILNGRSVVYADYRNIQSTLNYDFSEEKEKPYKGLNNNQVLQRLSNFTSSIWQVHPFGEGNTRTTAVFMECYLNNIGFSVDNEMFRDHSLYFRNALVVSNFGSFKDGISPDSKPLMAFYENLLMEGTNRLRNRNLFVEGCFSEQEFAEIKKLQRDDTEKKIANNDSVAPEQAVNRIAKRFKNYSKENFPGINKGIDR